MLVAVDQGDMVVGFATFLIENSVAELEDLFVDPAHMRNGIGRQLVVEIARHVRVLGFETLEVTANPHAMAFYDHMGFVPDRVVETQIYPALRMQRETF